MLKILTIAGSDSSGGAGIQADLKTIAAHKMYGMSAITALTAQNTQGVAAVLDATPAFVEAEIDAIFQDIVPDAVKIGMVSNAAIIESIAKKMREYQVKKLVIDPVMVATSGSRLLQENAIATLKRSLFPLATIITPNVPEAEILWNHPIKSAADMEASGQALADLYHCSVLMKGGHFVETAHDYLALSASEGTWLRGKKVDNPNTHGTGCTLSSSIACELAAGHDTLTSVRLAKDYLTGALAAQLDLGHGSGPLDHLYNLEQKE
jgi:hydroxymethylpyrimidine/phosphomethylpyrimidine kinase